MTELKHDAVVTGADDGSGEGYVMVDCTCGETLASGPSYTISQLDKLIVDHTQGILMQMLQERFGPVSPGFVESYVKQYGKSDG